MEINTRGEVSNVLSKKRKEEGKKEKKTSNLAENKEYLRIISYKSIEIKRFKMFFEVVIKLMKISNKYWQCMKRRLCSMKASAACISTVNTLRNDDYRYADASKFHFMIIVEALPISRFFFRFRKDRKIEITITNVSSITSVHELHARNGKSIWSKKKL